jgi:hypothetical protein
VTDGGRGTLATDGGGWANQTVAAILKVIVGIWEDWPKKGGRVATGDKSVKKTFQVLLLLLHVLN